MVSGVERSIQQSVTVQLDKQNEKVAASENINRRRFAEEFNKEARRNTFVAGAGLL